MPGAFAELAPVAARLAISQPRAFEALQALGQTRSYAKPGPYQTPLAPAEEREFRTWLTTIPIPFDPEDPYSDYDMRGFWKALKAGDPRATSGINPNDHSLHFTDYWKTPYHRSFSNESKFAKHGAPAWNAQDQLVLPSGKIVYDERAR